MCDDHDENWWLKEKFAVHGLVGLVNVKGFEPNYKKLVAMLDGVGIDHGFDKVHQRGLGLHIEEIFVMAVTGYTSSMIAQKFGVPTKTMSRFCARHGIELQRPLTMKDLEDDLRDFAVRGHSVREASEYFGWSPTAIYKFAKANGFVFRSDRPGYLITHNGYKMVLDPKHPDADSKGYVREHRKVMDAQKGEIVHHKNGDKLDNRPGNLEKMSLSDHAKLHATSGDTGWQKHHKNRGH